MLLISQNNSVMSIKSTLINNEIIKFVFLYFICFVSLLLMGIAIYNKFWMSIIEFWLFIKSWNLSLSKFMQYILIMEFCFIE